MALPNNVQPGPLDITIIQGATFSRTISFRDAAGAAIDLTGSTGEAKIRQAFSDAESLIDLTVSITDPSGGIVVIELTAAQTAGLSLASAHQSRTRRIGVWDLELTDSGRVERLLQGDVNLSQEATK